MSSKFTLSPDLFRSPGPSSSSKAGSTQEYNYLILFAWNAEVQDPFNLFLRTKSASPEIPDNWLMKSMVEGARLQKRKLQCMNGQVFSVFAKMERGMMQIRQQLNRISKLLSNVYYTQNIVANKLK